MSPHLPSKSPSTGPASDATSHADKWRPTFVTFVQRLIGTLIGRVKAGSLVGKFPPGSVE